MSYKVIDVDEFFRKEMDSFRVPKDKSKGLIESCSSSPILFAERMLGWKLYSWQVYCLNRMLSAFNGGKKEFAIMTSRQIGKSTLIGIFSCWVLVFNKYPGINNMYGNTMIGITSATDGQAKKLLGEIRKLLRLGDRYMKKAYGDSFPKDFFTSLLDEEEANNTGMITFKAHKENLGEYLLFGSSSGSWVKSFAPTSRILGETFSIEIIDEAGKTDMISDEFYNDLVKPTTTATDGMRIRTSTPWVSSGFFYRLMDPNDLYDSDNVERMVFTIDAIKDENVSQYARVIKEIDDMRSKGLLDEVSRAYYCKFVTGEQSYFSPSSVLDVFEREGVMVEKFTGMCDLGIDFGGQVSSRTVITISAVDDSGIIRRLYHRAYPVQKDLGLMDDVEDLLTRFNVQRIIPDDCPAGDYLIRRMFEKGWNVTPMNFRQEKVKKYGGFRISLNKGLIKSYEDDELKVEMLSMQYTHGKQSSVISHAEGERDDLIDSFVMSCYHFVIEDGVGFEFHTLDDTEEDQVTVNVRKKQTWWRAK